MNPNNLNAQELNQLALLRSKIQPGSDSDSDSDSDFGPEESSLNPDNRPDRNPITDHYDSSILSTIIVYNDSVSDYLQNYITRMIRGRMDDTLNSGTDITSLVLSYLDGTDPLTPYSQLLGLDSDFE